MPVEPRWLTVEEIIAAHSIQIEKFGGASGIRDRGLLESAVEVPANRWAYGGVDDLLDLAVSLCVSIARNHPFIDGNKRAATVAMIVMLRVNGYVLDMPNDTALGEMVEAVIVRAMTDQQFADALAGYVKEA